MKTEAKQLAIDRSHFSAGVGQSAPAIVEQSDSPSDTGARLNCDRSGSLVAVLEEQVL